MAVLGMSSPKETLNVLKGKSLPRVNCIQVFIQNGGNYGFLPANDDVDFKRSKSGLR